MRASRPRAPRGDDALVRLCLAAVAACGRRPAAAARAVARVGNSASYFQLAVRADLELGGLEVQRVEERGVVVERDAPRRAAARAPAVALVGARAPRW